MANNTNQGIFVLVNFSKSWFVSTPLFGYLLLLISGLSPVKSGLLKRFLPLGVHILI